MKCKIIIKYLIIYVIMIITLFSALYLSTFIPKEFINDNIKESAKILLDEGEEKTIHTFGRELYTNNSTDAIMLNLVYSIDTNEKLESIMLARRNYNSGITEKVYSDTNGDLPHESEKYLMCTELDDTVNLKPINSYAYARYWHGYITILRALLIFFNIQEIRIILEITVILLLITLMCFIYKKSNLKTAIIMMLSFFATDMISWITTVQGMFVIILALIASILIASGKVKKQKNINIMYFIFGGLTTYFDFLTTPLFVFLLPVVVNNIIDNEIEGYKPRIKKFITEITLWFLGYISVWFTKWLLVDLIGGTNIIELSIKQISYRMGIYSKRLIPENVRWLALYYNIINSLNFVSIIIYTIIYLSFFMNLPTKGIKYYINDRKIIYYICAIIPILWYALITEHSWQHYFFTYKTMLITILCLMLIIFDDKKVEIKDEKKDD